MSDSDSDSSASDTDPNPVSGSQRDSSSDESSSDETTDDQAADRTVEATSSFTISVPAPNSQRNNGDSQASSKNCSQLSDSSSSSEEDETTQQSGTNRDSTSSSSDEEIHDANVQSRLQTDDRPGAVSSSGNAESYDVVAHSRLEESEAPGIASSDEESRDATAQLPQMENEATDIGGRAHEPATDAMHQGELSCDSDSDQPDAREERSNSSPNTDQCVLSQKIAEGTPVVASLVVRKSLFRDMPPDEQAAASAMFDAADTDRNGVLDREELCALCRQLGFPNESVVDVVDGFLRRFAASEDSETLGRNGFVALYAMLRDDQDSRLQAFRDRQARDAREHAERTRARLQRLAASASEAPEQGVPSTLQASADDLSEVEKRAAELMFKQADSNGNGSIDDTELLALCRRLGFAGDDATALATKTMKLSDRDNDGKLNFDEFLMLYAALYAQQESQKQQVESKIEEMAEEASRRTQTRVALNEDPRFLEKDLAFRAKSARQKTQLRVSARRASGQLTEIEQHAAAMMFDQADTDHNEWIDAEELQSLCVRLGFSHPELPDVVGRLMSQFDSGATGRLSRKDFMGLYAMLRVEEAQKLATFQAQTALNAEEHVNRTKQRVLNRKLHPDFEAKRRQRAQNEAEARHKAEQEALEMLSASEKSAALAMFEVADVDCNGWIDRKELRDLCLKLNFLDNEVDGVVSDFLARFGDASEELSKEAFLSMYAMLRKSESLRLDAYNQQMLEAAADHQQRTQARLERLANADDTELGSFQGHDGPETGPVALDSDSESTLSSSSTALSDQGKIRRCRTMRVELTSAQCRKVLATASNASVQLAKFLQVNLAESGAGRTLVSTALQTMFEVRLLTCVVN